MRSSPIIAAVRALSLLLSLLLTVTLLVACGGSGPAEEEGACRFEGATSPAEANPADCVAFLYEEEGIRTFELFLSEEDLAFLDESPAREEYVSGSIEIDGERFDNVGIRYKGSVGAFFGCTDSANPFDPTGPKTCLKLSMKVKFDEFVEGQRYNGVRRLQFHAMNLDPAMLFERFGYWLFREMGIAAPRTNHVRLVINGELAGLFLLVEQIDGQFTRAHFAEGGKGNLYKEAWPFLGSEQFYLDSLKTNRDEEPSAEKMLAFFTDIATDPIAAARKWLDVDYTLRLFAVDRALQNDDGFMKWYCIGVNCANHNFFFYEEVDNDRMWLIPWDLDPLPLGQLINPLSFPGDFRDINPDCTPMTNGMFPLPSRNPACDRLISALGSYTQEYAAHQQALLDGPLAPGVAEAKLAEWADQIRTAVAEAHAHDAGHASVEAWEDALDTRLGELAVQRGRIEADIEAFLP